MKSKEVDTFLARKKHPLTKEIEKVRSIILTADKKVDETIKWSTPTFMYKGNIVSVNMAAKAFVSLMFHKGALIEDKSGLLEGDGKEVRVARFESMKDIDSKKKALQSIIKSWIKLQD
jgi:hypothetical protein